MGGCFFSVGAGICGAEGPPDWPTVPFERTLGISFDHKKAPEEIPRESLRNHSGEKATEQKTWLYYVDLAVPPLFGSWDTNNFYSPLAKPG